MDWSTLRSNFESIKRPKKREILQKMHLIGQVLRSFEYAKGDNGTEIGGGGGGGKESPLEETMARLAMGSAQADEGLIR